ncbi:hypothetical protein EAI_05092, partial [Harpegnathos saltator]
MERVPYFKYLGCYITEHLDPDKEIKCKIEIVQIIFQKMKSLFCNNDLNLKIRQRMVKCYIWAILLYYTETWILKTAMINPLEAFEMWLHRSMLRILWTAMQTNERILSKAKVIRKLLITIKRRKLSYLCHVLRRERYRILKLIMKGKIEGRRGVSSKQI